MFTIIFIHVFENKNCVTVIYDLCSEYRYRVIVITSQFRKESPIAGSIAPVSSIVHQPGNYNKKLLGWV